MSGRTRKADRSWLRWLLVTVPAAALAGLFFGTASEFGPLNDGVDEGWSNVAALGFPFGMFMLLWWAVEEVWRKRKLRSKPPGDDPDQA